MSVRADEGVPTSRISSLLPHTAGLVVAATVLATHAYGRSTEPSLGVDRAVAWATFGAVLAMAAIAFRSGRWLALGTAAWSALALGISHAHSALRPVPLFGTAEIESHVERAKAKRVDLDRQAADLAAWHTGKLPADSMPCGVSGYDVHFVKGLPIGVPIYGSSYQMVGYSGPAETNRPAWERYGAGLERVLPERRHQAEALLAAHLAGFAEIPSRAEDETRSWALKTTELTLVLVASNGLALHLHGIFARLSRRRRA